MNNTNVNQVSNRPDRHGSNNPMYGRHHSLETRQKQKDAAIRRNQEYQKWKDSQHHLTMDEFLSNNPSVKEYIKVLADKAIKEQIDKFIRTQTIQKKTSPLNIWL